MKRLTRRQRNRALGQQDAANRCALCKVNLSEATQIVEDFLISGKFCSVECLEQKRATYEDPLTRVGPSVPCVGGQDLPQRDNVEKSPL